MEEFVKAAQSGDIASWNILYRQHEPWLYARALRICGNSPAAKDAVQDTFIQAYLKLQQLKDAATFPGWLKRILIRNCYRSLHRKNLTNEPVSFYPENVCEDELNDKLDFYAQQAKIYNTLSCLTETLQSVLLLRYFSAWQSYEQISKVLCIPIGTVRSRLSEAKQKMLEHWMKTNEDNEKAFQVVKEWNHFYSVQFSTVHTSLNSREKLLQHLDKNLQLIFTSGNSVYGRRFIEKEIEDDLIYGSCFDKIEVMSSGYLSIVEVSNFNSKEYPDRCPDKGIFLLYRNKNKVRRLNFHNSK